MVHPNPGSMQNPFGQEEYVGPNSNIFNNPYYTQQPKPQGSLMIPPGARYDQLILLMILLKRKMSNLTMTFVMGFDELGRPIGRKPRGLPPQNPFQGGISMEVLEEDLEEVLEA